VAKPTVDGSDPARQPAQPENVLNNGRDWDQVMQLLTPREREVARLVADGHTTSEVAAKLGIGRGTVKTHRKNVLRKLRLHSRLRPGPSRLRNGLPQP
jgi:DNA-binding CsgD family transcriptional regulator